MWWVLLLHWSRPARSRRLADAHVVVLKPGSRGANGLALGLKRERFADKPYLFDATWPADPVKITYVSLLSAPWEEQA